LDCNFSSLESLARVVCITATIGKFGEIAGNVRVGDEIVEEMEVFDLEGSGGGWMEVEKGLAMAAILSHENVSGWLESRLASNFGVMMVWAITYIKVLAHEQSII
jgi:hypothetical protein